jgi:hypothetical protein
MGMAISILVVYTVYFAGFYMIGRAEVAQKNKIATKLSVY